jgi:hypothetical protein
MDKYATIEAYDLGLVKLSIASLVANLINVGITIGNDYLVGTLNTNMAKAFSQLQ